MELGSLMKNEEWSGTRVPADQLASIIVHVLCKQITTRTAKILLSAKFNGDVRSVEQIITDENMLLRPLSRQEYVDLAQMLLEEKANMVNDIVEKQQHKKVKWFVGQMMARSAEGTVEPGTAEAVLKELLHLPSIDQS
jgi:aspartyl-tRNA(Asn)/glutamyl-tRNA(Gln) amidotransferase subunit B